MEFIPARNFTKGPRLTVDVVVIHTMESPEGKTTAEDIARWFAGSTAPQASAHYCVDVDSVVQGVKEEDIAWAAPGANHDGIQIELAGRAGQSTAEWADPYSRSQLALAALLTAGICKRWSIPARYLGVASVRAGERGITTHANVSLAFGKSTHWDPGPNFPLFPFLSMVNEALAPKLLRTWPVPIPAWFWPWAKWRLGGRIGPRPASTPLPVPLWAFTRLQALIRARNV